jgi:hypothetical protein
MQTQEHVVQSSLESSIDKGPYVNLLEDGMVAAVTNEDTNIHDSLVNPSKTDHSVGTVDVEQNRVTKMLQGNRHSAITNTSSLEDNTTHSQREELSTNKIHDAIAPVKKSMNQLIRSQGRSLWWLAYIAVVTSWPLLSVLYGKKFRNSLLAKWLRS